MLPEPSQIELRYEVSSTYLEQQALRGQFEDRVRTATLEPALLEEPLRRRALALHEQLAFVSHVASPIVFGTGIDHSSVRFGDDDTYSQADPIYRQIGRLPRLDGPADGRPEALLDAYERWIAGYRAQSRAAVAEWASRWAPGSRELDVVPEGVKEDFWRVSLPVRQDDGSIGSFFVDARDAQDLDAFIRVRSARIRLKVAARQVGTESWNVALDIVGAQIHGDVSTPAERIVRGYEAYVDRFVAVALAHHHRRRLADDGFADAMSLWAQEHGSERLKLGLDGGYRMTSVYLEERLDVEAPGFYAVRVDGRVTVGKDRTGPSEYALRMAAAVQQHLDTKAGPGLQARVRWVEYDDVPPALRHPDDDFGGPDPTGGAEAIVIARWLGRYNLIAVVPSPSAGAPEWVAATLDPGPYGVTPPGPTKLDAPADDDIPF